MKKHWLYLAFLILIPVVFFKAFSAHYVVWDDDVLILNNPLLKAPFWEALKSAFSVYYHGDYFPLTLMSYWLDGQLLGQNAVYQHIENLVLHLLATWLLLSVLIKLTKDEGLSFLVALVFAIHPLQMESVMWLSERKSLLSAIFTFLSLHFYLGTYDKPAKKLSYGFSALFFLMAGLTKATGILMPFLFLVLDGFHHRKNYRLILNRFAPMAGMAVILVAFRIQAYASSTGTGIEALYNWQHLAQVPVMAFNALGFYIKEFFVTSRYSPIYPDFESSTTTILLASVAALSILKITAYVWRSKEMFLWFSWAWFLLFLAPVLQIFPRINYVNDRYMYLPIIGLASFFLYLLKTSIPEKYLKPKVIFGLALLVIVKWGLTTHHRSEAFVTNRALWAQAVSVVPESVLALNNLGLDYHLSGNLGKAIEFYDKVIRQEKESPLKSYAYNNLANIFSDKNYEAFDPEKSIVLLRQGIETSQRVRDTYELRTNLGLTYKQVGKFPEARQVFSDVLADLGKESDYRFQWIKPIVEKNLHDLPQ